MRYFGPFSVGMPIYRKKNDVRLYLKQRVSLSILRGEFFKVAI